MAILVTGGAGFIGSHTCVELLQSGEEVVIFDSFANSKPRAVELIEELSGKKVRLYHADLLDANEVERAFAENAIESVIHFAGLKAVGESVQKPLLYYHNNLTGTFHLIDAMQRHGVKRIVFSSSATVYGMPKEVPMREDFPTGQPENPYGRTKLMIEQILTDIQRADPTWSVVLLRYFNPIGAHKSGKIGEDPNGIPNNLMPYICQVAAGRLDHLNVFGNDYPTHDGTGVRDYIHVVDLARGHVKAIAKARSFQGTEIYNLGTGIGYSVLDVVHAFERASGVKIPYQIAPRRAGDIAECFADPAKAKRELGWTAQYGLDEMCADAWNFIQKNPNGL